MAARMHNNHSLQPSSTLEPTMARARSMPKLAMSASPVQPRRQQPPRPPMAPRTPQSYTVSSQLVLPHCTLPRPSQCPNFATLSCHQEERNSVTCSMDDNVYSTINEAMSVDSSEGSQSAPLYAVPDVESVYAGLIAATFDQGTVILLQSMLRAAVCCCN